MASLHPPSPSPSPGPANGRSPNFRASMGPTSSRPSIATQGLSPASPRPGAVAGAGRPTSELLSGSGMFQTPEAEAIDQWFENLQNYEATLEEMAAASLDVNFKEELSAIEQWFKVLSEAERTAALYSLLQHSTQVQIRFFITVLQQMARADPMTALLSPAVGGSMQSQMEAKLVQMNLKSPGLKSNLPASPTARNFSNSMSSNFLSPDSASLAAGGNDPAATLAQQRAKLRAGSAANAAHRISAPVLGSAVGDRNTWGSGSNQLGQVDERSSSPASQELTVPSPTPGGARPKSTDFSGVANAFKSPRPNLDDTLSPMVGDSWASMVNTPLMPMFAKERNPGQSLDAAAAKLNDWTTTTGPGVPLISDPPKKLNRLSKGSTGFNNNNDAGQNNYGDNPNNQPGQQRNVPGGLRNANNNGFGGQPGWNGSRSPALSQQSDGSMNGLGVGGFNLGMNAAGLGMGLPGAPGFNMAALAGMAPVSPFNNMFNMPNLAAMGLTPEQILTMQMAAAAGQLGQNGLGAFMGMPQSSASSRSGRSNMRSPGVKSPSVRGDPKKDEEEVDPKLLEDVPAWLRSLRLHKYTPNFEDMTWKEMVAMDEAALEAKGVAALGARRKMLKTFEVVRKKMGIDPPASANTSVSS
ncbi:uncharacterized protein PHACADRAFT_265434 [Phanerochaete carnosa HHB-10118-sp]|uniref:RNA-binding protein VTS1 n=1 Tax=Phanerochaete carnosa (strain HHB-10118-sp) TaxID=650164 RepID=K5WHR1_PHACS|nr:uncharacterized protein PHACADRAFT_265434 [Phanerochaete carnosa HHB-10118-sp]EKM49767.1 hypothetical protein PHACADRAFT_265434 [Phanerochaete carnosa HHB-10118-sp]